MLLAAIATLLGATLQSATGFGFALVLGPALFGVLEPEEALTTLLILGTALNLLVLRAERRPRNVRANQLTVILAAAVPGVILGVRILRALSKPALQIAVGVAVAIAAGVQARASVRAGGASTGGSAEPRPRLVPAAVGLTTGILTTSTGTSGPPLVLWFQRLGLPPGAMMDTLAAIFLALNVLGSAALFAFGEDPGTPDARYVLGLLVLTVVGYLGGRALFERLDHSHFRAIGLGLVVAAGAGSVIAGVAG